MNRLKRLSLWDRALLAMCAAVLLDFLLDFWLTYYLVLATMVAVAVVAWVYAIRVVERWLWQRGHAGPARKENDDPS